MLEREACVKRQHLTAQLALLVCYVWPVACDAFPKLPSEGVGWIVLRVCFSWSTCICALYWSTPRSTPRTSRLLFFSRSLWIIGRVGDRLIGRLFGQAGCFSNLW